MRIFEKILCPVDFSESSIKAVQWTQRLAQKYGSRVIFLHVIEAQEGNFTGDDYDSHCASVATRMQEFLVPLRIKHERMLSSGDPSIKIVSLASGLDASLIVMGNSGTEDSEGRIRGSITEKVVRESNVPVFTVPAKSHEPEAADIRRVLVPVYRLDQGLHMYSRLRRILRELKSEIVLMHVLEPNDTMLDQNFSAGSIQVAEAQTEEKKMQLMHLGARLHPQGRVTDSLIKVGDAAREILKEANSGNYDCVLLGGRRRTFVSPTMESTAYQVLSESSVPVITVHLESK